MKQRYVLAMLAVIATAAPAAAQQMMPPGSLPPHEILALVRSAGLDPLGPPIPRGIHYALRAIGDGNREVNVLVDARSGGIVAITPVATASRQPRGVPFEPGPYDPPPPGYVPGPPGVYRSGPPVVYQGQPGVYRVGPPVVYEEDDPPVVYGERPPGMVPNGPPVARGGPPRVIPATPSDEEDLASAEPNAGRMPGRAGALPPPPERFPQRAPLTAAKPKADKPKAEKRTVAAMPKQAPLPKPRPAQSEPSAPAKTDPPAAAPQKSPDANAVPN